jgi:hypothetical protein
MRTQYQKAILKKPRKLLQINEIKQGNHFYQAKGPINKIEIIL